MNKRLNISLMALAFASASLNVSAQTDAATSAQQKADVDLDAKYATNLLEVGSPAPDLAIPSLDGGSVTFADYKGKYVVVDFWASWCPDCRKDAPNIVALYEKFHKKGVEFLGVSFDRNQESWKKGVEALGLPYTQVSDLKNMRESDVAQAYHISWIPTVYVIDPQGNVALATVMSEKVAAYLTSVFPDCE